MHDGPWRGWYAYDGKGLHHKMDVALRVEGEKLTGSGMDDIGAFKIRGRYDAASGHCKWIKSYVTHPVAYEGSYDGRCIRGSWSLLISRGIFCLWPDGADAGAAAVEERAEPAAASAVSGGAVLHGRHGRGAPRALR